MIFNAWLGYFVYVSYPPCGITLSVLNYVLILSLSISTGLPSSKKLHKPHLIYSTGHSTFSIYCTNLFLFLHFSRTFTFLEIIRHNMQKMLLFLPSSILKWLHKNSILMFFFSKCTPMWQLSQYNLTKLYWIKLKTIKHYYSYLVEKANILANAYFPEDLTKDDERLWLILKFQKCLTKEFI